MKSRVCLIVVIVFLLANFHLGAQQTSSSPKATPTANLSIPDPGAITDWVYRNPSFGFSYKLPIGWVDRTADMRQDSAASSKAMVLLGVFEHPPEATTSKLNSAVVIAAESASSYPGLKAAAQYFGPLSEVATEKGLTAVNEPYEFPVDARPIVRRDFAGQVHGLAVQQSTLVLLEKNYLVSFTFIANDNDEMIELIEKLAFGKVRNPSGK
jgi:hypothetical protein